MEGFAFSHWINLPGTSTVTTVPDSIVIILRASLLHPVRLFNLGLSDLFGTNIVGVLPTTDKRVSASSSNHVHLTFTAVKCSI